MIELQNEIFHLTLDPAQGTFSIMTKDDNLPDLTNARLGIRYRVQKAQQHDLAESWGEVTPTFSSSTGEHGEVQTVSLILPGGLKGLNYQITFGIVQEYPLVVWKVKVANNSGTALWMDQIEMLEIDPSTEGSRLKFAQANLQAEMGFYSNGWQSWSPAGWVPGDGRMPHTRLGGLQAPMIYNAGTPRPGKAGYFSSDFFAVCGDRVARTGFLLGFLAQKEQFGSIEADFHQPMRLRMWANCDGVRLDDQRSLETDWAVFNPVLLDHRDPLDKYLEAVERENHITVPEDSPVGWCSWYYFYTHISDQVIRNNLASIVAQQEKLPVQLVQIDDGFESQVGDWFSFKDTFPQGVSPLAQEIRKEGLIPGLWLAPFIVHPKSRLFRQHPDWILRKGNGRPVNAGYVWETLDTALDLTVPEALEYACSVVRTAVREWGYPYLKLDFLYAAALPGRYHDPTVTRAQVLRKGMEALRDAVGAETMLLGCGAPFGSMLGLVEAMRIGPDVSGDWNPTFNGIRALIHNEPSFPCARNSIHDILTRANLHKHWWINDPDCLLIRPDSNLSLEEVKTLATVIGVTGGSLLLSDDLPNVPAERLRIAEVLLPVIGERARVLDWFDAEMPSRLRVDLLNETGEWHLLAAFNWQDMPADLSLTPAQFDLPDANYWLSDFWGGRTLPMAPGDAYILPDVPAHGCVLLSLRRTSSGPQYSGSNLHFSMGSEVAEWQVEEDQVQFTLRLPRKAEGVVRIALPWKKPNVFIDGQSLNVPPINDGVLEIPIQMDGFSHVRIEKVE